MTEAEWLAGTDSRSLLEFLRQRQPLSRRKLRLFAAACCRSVLQPETEAPVHRAVALLERYADGTGNEWEWHEAASLVNDAWWGDWGYNRVVQAVFTAWNEGERDPFAAALDVAAFAAEAAHVHCVERTRGGEQAAQAAWVRDLVPNPFRPAPPCRSWREDGRVPVRPLAEGIYEERAFDRLPILGDALEDADCWDAAVLDHCRAPGGHVRGCWVLDLVLGRS